MISGTVNLPHGMNARPADKRDRDFLAKMYKENRDDLRMADAEKDYIETVIEMQLNAQQSGYGTQFAEALYFILEKNGSRIGKFTLNIASVELRLIDLDFIKKAQNKGYGSSILLWLMKTAAQTKKPLLVPARRDDGAMLKFLHKYGYTEDTAMSCDVYSRMMWFPTADEMNGLADIKPRAAVPGTV
jgi:GNAT superfamily N-acetyltransferase